MDFSDHATQQEELMRELALKRAANMRLPCPQSGRVTGAREGEAGHRFCDCDCRDLFDMRARMEAISGKR